MRTNKLILMLIAVSVITTSCFKSDGNTEPSPYQKYIEWYRITNAQNDAAIDPFNVAYRLNMYIGADKSTPEKEEAARFDVFGAAKITQTGDIYRIEYSNLFDPSYDMKRSGSLDINTYGTSLSDIDASWTIATTETSPYIAYLGFGPFEQKIEGHYLIETTQENSWNVIATSVYQKYQNLSSNWSINFNVKQTKGNQIIEIEDREFELITLPGSFTGGKSMFGPRFKYETTSSVLYSSKCNFGTKAGGTERIILMDDYGIIGKDTATYDMGTILNCNPTYTLTVKINGKDASTVL